MLRASNSCLYGQLFKQHTKLLFQFLLLLSPPIVIRLLQAFAANNINSIAVSPFDFEHCLPDLSLSELLRLKKSLNGIMIAQTRLKITEHMHVTPMQLMMNNAKSRIDVAISNSTTGVDIDDYGVGGVDIDVDESENCQRPFALALVNNNHNNINMKQDRGGSSGYITKPVHTTYHHYHPYPWQPESEKPSKLQTLFQISITALAFLSFGGYLLCLIVQAIKSKGTTYFHPVATATTAMMNGTGVRRIKIYRRSRRSLSTIAHKNTTTIQLLPYAFWAAQYASNKNNNHPNNNRNNNTQSVKK